MGEDSEGQPLRNTGSGNSEKLAALTARVAALERQIATLSAALAESTGEPPALAKAAPPPAPTAGPGTVFAAAPPPKLRPDSLNAPVPTFAAAAIPPAAQESLERRLGSQVFSRVGIIALLIGATWFLKLAIDNGWLGPTGRVLAGLIAGTGLVVWSERFRLRGYAAFSYSLKAVGSGVLYLSLWAAFQLYHLLPAEAALAAMLLVSAWNAYMAWAQNAEVLAAYALIGGLATPLLLSTGGNHENFLFIYLLAIDVATIVLVRLRPWSRLLLGVFPATVVYFIGWYIQFYRAYELTVTSIYITLFFLVFASVPWRGVVDAVAPGTDPRRAEGSVISEILLPLANAAFGSLAFYSVLHDSGHPDVLPWMVLLFAAAYLGMVRLPQSAAASAVHLSLAIVFITIAIPLKASGHWITVSWLVEGAVLMWVAARLAASGPVLDHSPADAWRVLRTLDVGALLLGLGGLLLQVYSYDFTVLPAFFNHRFATALIGIAAFSTTAWVALHAREGAESEPGSTHPAGTVKDEQHLWLHIGGGSIIAVNVIAILATVREISAQWSQIAGNPEANLQQALAISAFLMLYGAALLTVGFWKRTSFIRWQALALIVFTIAKTFLYDMRDLSQGYRVASFMALGALLLGVSFAYQNDWLALRNKKQSAGLHSEEPR